MEELIPLQHADNGEILIDLRDLHNFLEVKTQYAHWVKRKVRKYDFVEDVDYTVSKMANVQADAENTWSVAYYATVSMAKELSMLQNNAKGKQARKHFIAIEAEHMKAKLDAPKKNAAELFMESAQLFNQHENRIAALENTIASQRQLAEQAQVAALALPGPSVELKGESTRQLLNERINYYVVSTNHNITHQAAWNILYSKAYYRLGIRFNLLGNKLDQVEKKGKLDLLYALACEIFPIEESTYKASLHE